MSAVGRAFEQEVKAKMAEEERLVLISAARAAYLYIINSWPVYTGYSNANNRVSITGRDIKRIEPTIRRRVEGLYVGKAAAVHSSQLAKLSRIELNFGLRNRRIVLGNAVDYAAEAGRGEGRAIYQQAAVVAELTARVRSK